MALDPIYKVPFNIDLITVSEEDAKKLQQVTEGSIFDHLGNFNSNGLFSVEIFGQVGSEIRNRRFAYIDLHCEVLHPIVYFSVIQLKSFYDEILAGRTYALWDEKTKSFIKDSSDSAQTGYEFFISHIEELVFEETNSDKRKFLIKLFDKAKKEKKLFLRYHLVLPAGLRDYFIDSSGKPQEDEINTYYRKLLYQSSLIEPNLYKKDKVAFDSIRYSIQKVSYDIFEYLKSLLEGKNKLILGKWVTRKVFNSTRNVLSSAIEHADSVDDENRLGYNECFVGLHQFLRVTIPKCFYEMKTKFLKDIFIEQSDFAKLVDVKTLKSQEVLNNHIQKDYELWTTLDGLEKQIANFQNLYIRHEPILLGNNKYYLALVYNDGKKVKVLHGIEELPEEYDKKYVTPMTYAEFFYLSIEHLNAKIPALITRYPVTGYGSIFPAFMKIKTTIKSQKLEEVDDSFIPTGKIYSQFPIKDIEFFNTVSVHNSHLALLGADFDGDTVSVIGLLTEEAQEEVKNLLSKKEYYLTNDNRFNFSSSNDTLDAVLAFIT